MNQFKEIGINPRILRAIEDLGFSVLFPIQEKAIPPLMEGKDVIGQSHTGSGKTAAFGIPLISKVEENDKRVQALVLTPTRELAVQVAKDINAYAKYTEIRALAVYGGESIENQFSKLRNFPRVVVATPGRLIDHLRRGSIKLSALKFVVLDEADRMLDMGFIEDVEYIMENAPIDIQTARSLPRCRVRYCHYLTDTCGTL